VAAAVEIRKDVEPFPAGTISVALSGNVCSAFVQTKQYYTAYHVMVLYPKKEMSLSERLFYCMCIKANAYRYAWGRQANKTLKDIDLPDIVPNWARTYPVKQIKSKVETIPQKVDVSRWKYFPIGGPNGIFRIENCKCGNAGELESGKDVFYIGAKKDNNGIMKKVAYDEKLITKGNCIVFICDGQGSVGYTNYMDRDFIGSTTLSVGYNHRLNPYNGLFLVTILDLERPKYSYGRKYRKHLEDTEIKLPVSTDGKPDFEFMERYIKNLRYSDRI